MTAYIGNSDTRRIVDFQGSVSVQTEDCVYDSNQYYIVLKRGLTFECIEALTAGGRNPASEGPVDATENVWVGWGVYFSRETFTLYRPIHPDMRLEDVNGATHAWDDGKFWHFAHASEDSHHEMALILEALTLAAFQPQIERAVLARFGAIDTAAIATTTKKLEALYEFRNDVFKAAIVRFYSEHMGHYHFNPHSGHYRSLIKQSIESVKSIWTGHKTKKLLLPVITTTLDSVESDLTPAYTVKTRLQKVAEAAKLAAATQTEGSENASS